MSSSAFNAGPIAFDTFPASLFRFERGLCLADIVFVAVAALYALAAAAGNTLMSSGGAVLDSDLSTYAFSMAGLAHPELFTNDPILCEVTPANSFWNLLQWFGTLLAPQQAYAVGLIRAGALTIFIGYTSSYILGRWLYGSPGIATLFAVLSNITVWVGWGTYWGLLHVDPIPRTLFSAIWPLFLLLGLCGAQRPALRPLAMFVVGCSVWIHGISGLVFGGMLFCAYFFYKTAQSFKQHIAILAICLVCYFLPVLFFLWASVGQGRPFTPEELQTFTTLFQQRWAADYTDRIAYIWTYLAQFSLWPPIFSLAVLAGILLVLRARGRMQLLLAQYPGFLFGLACVTLLSWAEELYAATYGRLPMGHELIRGLRFLIPLSWLVLVGILSLYWCRVPRLLRWLIPAVTVVALFLWLPDRQNVAVQHAITQWTSLSLPWSQKAEQLQQASQIHRAALDAVARYVPVGERVFSNDGDMGIRHIALRPMEHTFKDGSHPFYNKNIEAARRWLFFEQLRTNGPQGYLDAWKASQAPWLLTSRPEDKEAVSALGTVVWENSGWLLVRRNPDEQ